MNEFDSSAIIRDLEMLLDQLYFWAKRAQESRSTSDDGRMLGVATANLEAFVTTLLDCFRPLELVPIRVPTSDLVSAIAMRARRAGRSQCHRERGGERDRVGRRGAPHACDVRNFTASPSVRPRPAPRRGPCRARRTAWNRDRAPDPASRADAFRSACRNDPGPSPVAPPRPAHSARSGRHVTCTRFVVGRERCQTLQDEAPNGRHRKNPRCGGR